MCMVVLGRTVNALLRNTERGNITKYNAKLLKYNQPVSQMYNSKILFTH